MWSITSSRSRSCLKNIAHQEQLSATSGWRAAQASHEDWQQHLKKIGALLAPGRRSRLCRLQENTLVRRVHRRMQVLQLDAVSNDIARLAADPHEADLLFRELLIGVTEFFRNPEASQRRAAAPGHQNVAICFSGRRKG